ncbi:MAG: hypothetical protein KDE56_11705 [Anaerolineales bacterium]|nr:hypothetical protein [Anaerolineales bacterium]
MFTDVVGKTAVFSHIPLIITCHISPLAAILYIPTEHEHFRLRKGLSFPRKRESTPRLKMDTRESGYDT